MLCLGRYQRPTKHARWVAFAARRSDPIAEHAACKGPGLFGGLVLPLRLEALEGSQHFERLNLVDRTAADGGRQLVEEEVGLDDGRIRATVLHHHLIDVLACHRFECLGGKEFRTDLLLALLHRRVTARRDFDPRLISCLACVLDVDFGIGADRELLFDSADSIAESPEFSARWGHLDVQSAVVGDLVRFVLWLECAKPGFGQRHGRAFSQCGFRKGP